MTSKYSTSKKVNFPNAKDNYQLLCTVSRRKGTQLLMRVTIMPVHLNHFLWVKKTTSKKSMVGFRYWHLASRISHGCGRKIYLINSSVRILQNFSFVVHYIDDKYRRMKNYCTLTFPTRLNFCKAVKKVHSPYLMRVTIHTSSIEPLSLW